MPATGLIDYFKPERGVVGSAIGGWLDFVPSGRGVWFFLFWFVILWTAFQIISFASLGLNPDLLETYAWALHPSAGYYKHPPLGALIATAWFTVFPPADWSFDLMAMINAAVALYATDLIARRYLSGDKRAVVLLMLVLTPFYQFHAQRFGANQTLLSTWPIATYCFLRAFETRGLVWSAAAGATAALAMLGKYYSVFLLAGFLVAALAHPARWTYLRSASPWLSAAVGAVVLTPHIQWLFATGFTTFSYATALHTSVSFAEVLAADARYLAGGIAYVGVLLAVYWLAVRPDWRLFRETVWPPDPDGRMLITLLTVPLALPAIAAPLIGAVLTPLWTMPAWFLLPIVLLRPQAASFSRVASIRTTVLVVAVTLASLAAAPWLAWRYHETGSKEGREYYRPVSAKITDAWHLFTATQLRIVQGEPGLASAVTFYSPDHPDSVPNFQLRAAPWVTPDRLNQEGFATICMTDDKACLETAQREATDKANTQVVTFSTTSRYRGDAGKLGRFTFILVPPQGTRPPPVR